MAPNPPALMMMAPPPPPPHTSSSSSSRKRQHAEDFQGAGPAAKRAWVKADVVFRLLVPAGKIGKVIGKQGCQIKQLREETSAHIKIADPVSNMEDRTVLISSRDDASLEKTCAEVALLRVASLLLEDREGPSSSASAAQHQGSQNLTRLLISGSQAGSLIGKGGATIKEIRDCSSANVRVLPSDQLPLCSAASETDRLVQISGDPLSVEKGIELVSAKLRENPPKDPPPVAAPASRSPAYFLGIDGRTGHQVLLPPVALSIYGLQPGMSAFAAPPPPPPLSVLPKVTSEMSIPSALMGGLIGRGGSHITQIRSASGASIKVHGTKEGSAERSICFEGTEEQVALAQNMVNSFLNGQ